MSLFTDNQRADNQSILGDDRDGLPASVIIVNTPAGKVSAYALLDSAGGERFLWFTVNGTLMTGTRAALATPNAAADAAHVIVGLQSAV